VKTVVRTPPPRPAATSRPRTAAPEQQFGAQPAYPANQQYWREPQYAQPAYAPRPPVRQRARSRDPYDPWQGWTFAR
jgi:hypothetical protein